MNAIQGVSCPLVEGAFYAFADIRGTGMSSPTPPISFREANVAVTPGIAFRRAGEAVRLSFATSDELLDKAVDSIGNVLGFKSPVASIN